MNFGCSQVLLRVSDLGAARRFYVEGLGLEVIGEYPKMFAVRAGAVRFSVFGGGKARAAGEADPPSTVMLRTDDLDSAMRELTTRGIEFDGEVETAPGFMRYVSLLDPDGNQLYIAEYIADPLQKPAAS